MRSSIGVTVFERNTLVRFGLLYLLDSNPLFRVLGHTGRFDHALTMADQLEPEIALFELESFDSTCSLRGGRRESFYRDTRVIHLSDLRESLMAELVINQGAKGYLLRSDAESELTIAMEEVARGNRYVSDRIGGYNAEQRSVIHSKVDVEMEGKLSRLSRRECSILLSLGEAGGRTNKEVAEKLYISPLTVQKHRENIAEKLDIRGPGRLLVFASRQREGIQQIVNYLEGKKLS
jgi:DNA-binding NarL/FixJ family response regulator